MMRPTPAAPAPRRRRALPLAALGAAAALTLTGCGASGSDAGDAWSRARAQLEDAQSLSMATELTADSGVAADQGVPEATEARGAREGDLEFALIREDGAVSSRQETRVVGGEVFTRTAVERSGGVAGEGVPEYAQKWVSSTDSSSALTGMGPMVDSLVSALPAGDALQGADVEASPIRRSGQDAVRYVLEDPLPGSEDQGVRLRAFTVAEDDGELLTVETLSAGTGATVTFSDWNAVGPVEAPAEEDRAG